MGSVTFNYTSNGTEGPGTVIDLGPFAWAVSGDVQIQLTTNVPMPGSLWLDFTLERSRDNYVATDTTAFPDAGATSWGGFWLSGSFAGVGPTFYDVCRMKVHAFSSVLPLGTTWSFTVTNSGVNPVYCQYGTEPQQLPAAFTLVTDELLATALSQYGLGWLAPVLAPIVNTTLDVGALCGSGPGPAPTISSALWFANPFTLLDVTKFVLWPYFCKCIDGTPSPTPPPPPNFTQPPDWPRQTPLPCSDTDLCAYLVQLRELLFSISRAVGADFQLDTAVQRFAIPFAYINGAVHDGLAGSASFAVSRLLGLRVEVTSTPGVVLPGNPAYLWDQGWLSVSDGGGMLQQKRITRTSMEWLPPSMQLATLVGYYTNPGVTIRITELRPEE